MIQNAFDQKQALSSGVIVPRKGVIAEYDDALEKVAGCVQDLDAYLDGQRKKFKSQVRWSFFLRCQETLFAVNLFLR